MIIRVPVSRRISVYPSVLSIIAHNRMRLGSGRVEPENVRHIVVNTESAVAKELADISRNDFSGRYYINVPGGFTAAYSLHIVAFGS